MRAPVIQSVPPPLPETAFPAWEPEMPSEDDLAQVAAQARFGVQQKATDEAWRRKRQRMLMSVGIAVVAAGTLVLAFQKLYDPEARAREAAIAENLATIVEKQQVSDNLASIEFDIETAIINNDLDTARTGLATLIEKAPDHPRREFLEKSIERTAAVLLSEQNADKAGNQGSAKSASIPNAGENAPAKPRAERKAERVASRSSDRNNSSRSSGGASPPPSRTYGAPLGESTRQTIPLNAPINSSPVTNVRRNDNSFPGRTVESGDGRNAQPTLAPLTSAPPPQAPAPVTTGSFSSTPGNAGSAVVPMPNTAPAPAPAPPPPVDVVPAKIVKRVTPVAPGNIPAKTTGYVVVRFNIGVNGRVSDLEVVESEPKGVFDDAAQNAVRKWVYEPRKENGFAVESVAKARLVFDAAN